QLMDAARISSGKIHLNREELDLLSLVRSVLEDHASLLSDAGLRVLKVLPAGALIVSGDRLRLSQALGNLVTNAAKFTERGGTVTVTVRADGSGEKALVTVADTGVGVEPAMLERLFQPFTQASAGVTRGRSGLGLGLALVKGLVESHGGTVEARSSG